MPTFTLSTPVDGRVHQRASGVGTITVTGTYTGSPASIQARVVLDTTNTVVGADWTTKVASPAGSVFSFTLPGVAQGGWYNVQVRDSAIPGTVITSGKVGVGILVAVLGQSQAYLWFRSKGDSTLTPNAKLRVTGNIGSWIAADTATSNGAIAFGNSVVTATGLPVGLIDYAWSGSGLIVLANGGQWVPLTNPPYAQFKTYMQTIDNACEGCVWIQGESDAEGATVGVVTTDSYYAGLNTLFSTLRTDFGASMPIVMVLNAKRTDGTVIGIDDGTEIVRNAQVRKCSDTGIYRVEREDIPLDVDNVHHTPAGFTTMGTRCAQAFNYTLGLVSYYRGPRIASARRAGPKVYDLTIAHSGGTDFTPSAGLTGWRVLDGASPITVSAATRISATTIRLTLASVPTSVPTIQHLYGATPDVSGIAKDNSGLALPLEFNDGILGAIMANGDSYIGGSRVSQTGQQYVVLDPATSVIGTVGIDQTTPGTTNGVQVVPNGVVAGGLTNIAVPSYIASGIVKASPGIVYSIKGYNSKASAQFIQIFDSATVPADGTPPNFNWPVAASSPFDIDFGLYGMTFAAGISVANSSTPQTKTVGAADCQFFVRYK